MGLLESFIIAIIGYAVYEIIKVVYVIFLIRKHGVDKIQELAQLEESEERDRIFLDQTNELRLKQVGMQLYIEEDDHALRAYAMDDLFICQGKTLEELADNFHIRFPSEIGYIENYNMNGEDIVLLPEHIVDDMQDI